MPAARYWRVVGVSAVGGSDLELSTLHLYSSTARVDTSATLSSSHAPAAGTLADLHDANDTTVCVFSAATLSSNGFWLAWDFGGAPADVANLRVGSGSSLTAYLAQCLLQYHDGAVWVTLRTVLPAIYPGPLTLGGVTGDSDYAYSVLRLHASVPVGSATAPDSSQYGSTASSVGGASIVSLSGPFGNAFSGNGSAWSVPSASRFDLRLQDFKLECLIRPLGTSSANQGLVVRDAIGGTRGWLLYLGDGTGGSTAGAVAFALWNGGSVIAMASTFVPPVGVDTHIAVTRWAGVFRLWINGSLVATISTALTFDSPASTLPITIGALALAAGYNSPFNGSIDEVDLTVGRAVFTAPFTPRTTPLEDFEGDAAAQPLRLSARRTAVTSPYFSYSPGSVGARPTGRQRAYRDLEFGGRCAVVGVTKIKGEPNSPFRCRVRLLRDRDAYLVRETWSDATTGAFIFEGLSEAYTYTAYAQDHTGNYRAVVADRITPEVPA